LLNKLLETSMADDTIRFDDGASYEIMMGRWSMLAGEQFLHWLGAPAGKRWVDVGCGNGAFTELMVQRCAPLDVQAFDPAPAQLDYARKRLPGGSPVQWAPGDAMRLPLADASVDVAVMALVLFFVPEPAIGVAEMCRVVCSGGLVAAYHWDMLARGFPLADIGIEMLKVGISPRMPPSVNVSTIEASCALWTNAGLKNVRTTQIAVQRKFASFDDYWNSAATSNALRPMFDDIPASQIATLKASVQLRLPSADDGSITVNARANAICGVKA
jgi:ubiquinone/menaquinone biosynthesis C-methylase UbiE